MNDDAGLKVLLALIVVFLGLLLIWACADWVAWK